MNTINKNNYCSIKYTERLLIRNTVKIKGGARCILGRWLVSMAVVYQLCRWEYQIKA